MALVTPLMFRVILAAPVSVISAAIVGAPSTGILAICYAVAVAVWWMARIWTRVVHSSTTTAAPFRAADGGG